ncbi:MAG: hypothetical protein M1459_01070 [Patescibacteria group bacterium]|nr:hypothetical protein [Patescibacteria group bacterium]
MYSTSIHGIQIQSNEPFSGSHPGHWQIDLQFRIPYIDYLGYLADLNIVGAIAQVYAGSVMNFRSYAVNNLDWRIEFDVNSPEILPLLEVVIPLILTVIGLYIILDIVLTISKNPILSTGFSILMIAGAGIIGLYIYSKVKKK